MHVKYSNSFIIYLAIVGTGTAFTALPWRAGGRFDERAGLPVTYPLLELKFDQRQDLERHEGVDEGLPAVVAVVALKL